MDFIKRIKEKKEIEQFYELIRKNMLGVRQRDIDTEDSLYGENLDKNYTRRIYPFSKRDEFPYEYEKMYNTENYIILFEKYIRGAVCSVYDKSNINENKNCLTTRTPTTDDLKDIPYLISYADQTGTHFLGVNDVDLPNKENFLNALPELIKTLKKELLIKNSEKILNNLDEENSKRIRPKFK